MKKIIIGLLLVNCVYGTEWYLANVEKNTCEKEKILIPKELKKYGLKENKVSAGMYIFLGKGKQVYLATSKQKCKVLMQTIKEEIAKKK